MVFNSRRYLNLHGGGKEADNQKYELPRFDCDWVCLRAHGDTIGNDSTEDLTPSIKAEPKGSSRSLDTDISNQSEEDMEIICRRK